MFKKLFPVLLITGSIQSCIKSTHESSIVNGPEEPKSSANISQAAVGLQSGLFAYYPFNGDANDYSGNILNGTPINVSLTTDRKGKTNSAYYFPGFTGVAGYSSINLPGDNYTGVHWFSLENDFTISLWLMPTEWTYDNTTGSRVVSFVGLADRYYFGADKTSDNPLTFTFHFYSPTAADQVQLTGTSGTISLNVWTHIAVTYNKAAKTIKHYKDGILIKEQSNVALNLTFVSRYTLLGAGNSYGLFFTGKMDEVRFYNRALSDKEIKSLAK